MLASLLSIAILGAPQEAVPTVPLVPAGTNRSFHEAVLAIEESMEKKDFAEAARRLKAMPRTELTITWDDSAVPADLRGAYAEARDKALKSWATVGLPAKIKIGEKGHLVFSFDKQLPDSELGVPKGAAHLFSFDPAEPRLRTVIGLHRGNPANRTIPAEVSNEVLNAISQYYGVEVSKRPLGARYRTDLPTAAPFAASPSDVFYVQRLQKVTESLKAGIDKKVPFKPSKPKLFVELSAIQTPPVVQGESQSFSLTVTNNGDGPMSLWVEPDCSCLAPTGPPVVQPGQTALVKVNVNTIDWVGKLRKWLYVYSNDLDFPYREIPVDVDIRPLFRVVHPGSPVLQMNELGAETEFYFWSPSPDKIKPLEAAIVGLKGNVEMEKWEGSMADPEMGEAAMPRKGYKFTMKIEPRTLFGRASAALTIKTTNNIFPLVRGLVQVQKGIVALPERVYLGEIPKSTNLGMFILSKPEVPFKITKIETDNPHIKATFKPLKGEWEYRIDVEISSKVDFGFLNANIIVTTDDPNQPQVVVPLEAVVR